MRSISAGLLGLIVPGVGHAYIGRRRLALLFTIPVIVLAAAWLVAFLLSGRTSLIGFLLTPGVLPALAVVNVALAAWRIAAGVDAARRLMPSRAAIGALAVAILVLVLVPHLLVGRVLVSANDFLDSMFARLPVQEQRVLAQGMILVTYAALAGLIAGSRSVAIPDCGHMLLAEAPDAVLDALIDFCAPAKVA